MKTTKILNIVYPILILILGGLAVLAILENDWVVAGIYILGIVLMLLLPHLLLPSNKKAIPKKPVHKKEKKREEKPGRIRQFFKNMLKRKAGKKEVKKAKKVKKPAPKKKQGGPGFLKRFIEKFKRKKHAVEEEPAPKEPHEESPKEAHEPHGKRLYKTKKVLKVYQGKTERSPKVVEERGEKKIQLVEINKPQEKKGTSKQSVKTDFDRLIDLVNAKGVIALADAAKALGHEKDQIEAWAKLLEEHGLLQIVYPTFGEIKLKAVKKSV